MTLYTLRRLAAGLVLALLVTFITYMLLSLSFDSIVRTMLGSNATPDAIVARKADLGLDGPLVIQYFNWLGGVVRGDLGISFFTSEPVGPAVARRLGVTLSIVLVALALSILVSVALGVWGASRGGAIDRVAQGISLIGYIVPGLLLAIGLVAIFAISLKLLPATGFTPFTENPAKWLASITIPVIVLLIAGIADMTAQVRGAMIDELRKDYVRTLRAGGVAVSSIVLRHALRNAATPALTVLGFQFLSMLGGALIIEKIFALPGYGIFAFNASLQGDVPVIMGITAFGVLLVIIINLLVDIANGWLNPKARLY